MFTIETSTRMVRTGHEVACFLAGDPQHLSAYARAVNTMLHETRLHFWGMMRSYFTTRALRKCLLKAVEWHPDIILIATGYALADRALKGIQVPAVAYVHGPETLGHEKKWYREAFRKMVGTLRPSFKSLKLVICNSRYMEGFVASIEPNAITEVVYPGVDHKRFSPSYEDDGYVYYNSKYAERKNQLLLLKALQLTPYKLILTGYLEPTPSRIRYYEQLLKQSSSNVLVEKDVQADRVLSLLRNCSVFAFPSANEPFGIAPVEAMACGKPVVGHASGATLETVGDAGILCSDNVDEWRETIALLMENVELRRTVGRRCLDRAQKFSWEATTEGLIKCFKSVLDGQTYIRFHDVQHVGALLRE